MSHVTWEIPRLPWCSHSVPVAEGRAGLEVLWLLFALLLPFTNTGLLTCILYTQKVEGTQ